jgi:DNA-binding NtrC family response regulator
MELARTRFEREYLQTLLTHCDGNVSKAARVANISRRGLYAMMTRVGMTGGAETAADDAPETAGGSPD